MTAPRVRTAADVERLFPPGDDEPFEAPAQPVGSGEADALAVSLGLKPALRQIVDRGEVEPSTARFVRRGLRVEVLEQSPALSAIGRVVMFATRARAADALPDLVAAEREGDDVSLGRLLGYPRCCVEAYEAAALPRDNLALARDALRRTRGAPRARLDNLDLGVFHYVTWCPCAFDCAPSLTYADALAAAMRDRLGLGAFVGWVDEALSGARLQVCPNVALKLRFVGGAVREARPTFRDRHPAYGTSGPERRAALALARGCLGRSVEVRGDDVLFDGAVVLSSATALLVPFE